MAFYRVNWMRQKVSFMSVQTPSKWCKNPAWGSLHIVLDDGNVDDASVSFCQKLALNNGDVDGIGLADALAAMSRSQRLKLPGRIGFVAEHGSRDQRPA
ncbi:hypothetical protein [Nitrobacter hamburgensis]|uniref:hypothetical protein n=1 Tax=Nitrobacter hamburgensis TaxID=912 RepID=UPI00059B96AE|nr:hypothetical protein [Nitrobacter hamburgensis]